MCEFSVGKDYTYNYLEEYQQGSQYSMEETDDFEIGRSMLYFVNVAGATEYTFVLTGMTAHTTIWTLAWLAE